MAKNTNNNQTQLQLEFNTQKNNLLNYLSLLQSNEQKRFGKPCPKLQQIENLVKS